MSCFEKSTFLLNPSLINKTILTRACEELGWQYEDRQESFIVRDARQQNNLMGEYLLKVEGNNVTYNTYFDNGSKYVETLREKINHLNVVFAKETVVTEFEGAGFTLKIDYDFVPDSKIADSFSMVGISTLEDEEVKRIEIRFSIFSDGTVESDSDYIPEDLHEKADKAMERMDKKFGTERKEGEQIIRKEIPEKYKHKAYCTNKQKIKTKN